jgi:hypothetical protein
VLQSSAGTGLIHSHRLTPRENARRLVATVLLGLLPLLTAMAATPSPVETGLEGVISVSPSRPGPQKIDQPDVAPVRNVVFVVKKGETHVATFTTDAEGRFRIKLTPGHYIVLREDPGARIGHWRFEADVVANEMTKVHWTGDSGMR